MVWHSDGRKRWGNVAAVWLFVLVVSPPLSVFGQIVTAPTVLEQPSSVQLQKPVPDSAAKIVPSLRIAERYDSNVYFVRGRDLEDYVTTMSPGLLITRKSQWVDAQVDGGATGEVYVRNPELNYVGGNGTVDLNLDGAMNSLVKGLGLRVSDTIIYTPQPIPFASITGGSQISQAFVPGLQPGRTNTLWNSARVDSVYNISSFMGASVTYVDQRIRFGQTFTAPAGPTQEALFNTSFQSLTSGFVGKPTASDTVLLAHQFQKATFSNSDNEGNSGDSGFSTQGALVRWSRILSPELRATLEGGVTVIGASRNVQPVAAAALQWKGQYTTVQISYSRAVVASFLSVSTPLLSQVVDVWLKRHLTENLSLWLSGSYADNRSVPDRSLVRFESYAVSPSVQYQIGRNITAALSYTRNEFKEVFAGDSFKFDRDMVTLSVSAEWR